MAGIVIDRVSHALFAHRLCHGSPSRDISALPAIMEMTIAAVRGELRFGEGGFKVATDRTLRASAYKLVGMNRDERGALDTPRFAAHLRRDSDDDIVMDVREIEIARGVRLWRRVQKEPHSILIAGDLPDALAAGLAGRPLSQVISHPALDPLGLVVEEVWEPAEYQYGDLVLPGMEGPKTALRLAKIGKTIVNDR